ncbi:MAG: hypothetical protein ACREQV_03305 [Candidatus Binatia bacterium]
MPDSVAPAEKLRFHTLLLTAFRHWDNLYYQFRCGTLDTEMWQSYNYTMTLWLANEARRVWFRDNAECFSEHLRDLVQDRKAGGSGRRPQVPFEVGIGQRVGIRRAP